MKYCFDLDETLCHTPGAFYDRAEPMIDRIKKVNNLYAMGHTIVIQTGRRWDVLKLTAAQLKLWGLKYHALVLGNVVADFYINDKGINDSDFFKIK